MLVEISNYRKNILIDDGDIVCLRDEFYIIKSNGYGYSVVSLENPVKLNELMSYSTNEILDKINKGDMLYFSKNEFKLKLERIED